MSAAVESQTRLAVDTLMEATGQQGVDSLHALEVGPPCQREVPVLTMLNCQAPCCRAAACGQLASGQETTASAGAEGLLLEAFHWPEWSWRQCPWPLKIEEAGQLSQKYLQKVAAPWNCSAADCTGPLSQKADPTALPGLAGSVPADFVAVVTSAVAASTDSVAAVAEVVAAADGGTAVAVAAGHAVSCWSELERQADL